MTDGVLLGCGVLAEATAITFRRDEQWVVTKALVAGFDPSDMTFARAFGHDLAAVGPAQHHDGTKPRRACRVWRIDQLSQHAFPVRAIVVIAATEVRRLDSGRTSERVDFESTVVGKCWLTRSSGNGHCLEPSVPHKRACVFGDLGYPRRPRQKIDRVAEHGIHLAQFVIVCRRRHDHQWVGHS